MEKQKRSHVQILGSSAFGGSYLEHDILLLCSVVDKLKTNIRIRSSK